MLSLPPPFHSDVKKISTMDFIALFALSEMLPGIALPSKGIETGEGINDSRGSRDRSNGSVRVHVGFLLQAGIFHASRALWHPSSSRDGCRRVHGPLC